MKTLLIYPPTHNIISTNFLENLEGKVSVCPPLGLLYVASYAKKFSGWDISVIDAPAERMDYDDITDIISKSNPDVVGIQINTFSIIDALTVAKLIKTLNNKIFVVAGGPHVNLFPEQTISFNEIDYLVCGEGEISFTQLLHALEGREKIEDIKGLVYKSNNFIYKNPCQEFIDDLDALPYPAREMTDINKYYSVISKRRSITTMVTSRGCPYRCLFCDRPHLGKRFRYRTAENVVDEMQLCSDIGIKEIMMYDDTFTVNKKRVLDICQLIIDRDLKVGWDIRSRIDTIDEEIIEKLREAGCERIHYGVEAGTDEILKVLNKQVDLKRAKHIFKATRAAGIDTLGFFMIGNPAETREQILKTINYAKSINPNFVQFSLTTPYPGTELYKLGLEKGLYKEDYWKKFAENPTADFIPAVWEEHLSKTELIGLLKYAYKSFYLRPGYIFLRLLEIKSIFELIRKIKIAVKLMIIKKNKEYRASKSACAYK